MDVKDSIRNTLAQVWSTCPRHRVRRTVPPCLSNCFTKHQQQQTAPDDSSSDCYCVQFICVFYATSYGHWSNSQMSPPYICPAGFLRGWPAGVEFTAGLPERPGIRQRHFLQALKDVLVCSVLISTAHWRFYDDALHNSTFYLLTYLPTSFPLGVRWWMRPYWGQCFVFPSVL